MTRSLIKNLLCANLLACSAVLLQAQAGQANNSPTLLANQSEQDDVKNRKERAQIEEKEEREGTLPQGQGKAKRGPDGQRAAYPTELHQDEVYKGEHSAPDESQSEQSRLEKTPSSPENQDD